MTFQRLISPYKCIQEEKFDLAIKMSTFHHHLNKLDRPWVPDTVSKIQPQSFLGSGEEDFLVFSPYMGMAAISFNGMEPFEQIVNIPSQQKAHVKSGENCSSSVKEEDIKKLHNLIHVYSPGARADNPQNFDCN